MIISNNQSWLDISVLLSGTLENLFEITKANSASVTDLPQPGEECIEPDVPTRAFTKQYIDKNNNLGTIGETEMAGIGYWRIEMDFEVQ